MNSRLSGFDISVEEAAKDLGATTLQTFRYITFPLIRPSIIEVMMLTFALSFDEFLVTFFIIGKRNTLPKLYSGSEDWLNPYLKAHSAIRKISSHSYETILSLVHLFQKLMCNETAIHRNGITGNERSCICTKP